MKLRLSYSTCPNDTFIFYAIANKKIDLEGVDFEISLHDIDVLNKNAAEDDCPEITKISSNAYAVDLWKKYVTLNSGAALGQNNGPLLVAKNAFDLKDINSKKILIPGVNTTANLLFSIFFPEAKNKTPMLFSKIEGEILAENYDCGLLIHEGRFTYKDKGLTKLADMGELWEETFHQKIPLGTIIAKRSLEKDVIEKVNRLIFKSINYAFEHRDEAMPYIRENARELSDAVTQSHINLYVNEFSKNLGSEGKNAISFLYRKAFEAGALKELPENIFM
ncbi:MAG: 1,4-dihydroxy-6-naphthoate synthase [Bacteroidales bacterium]|nr:1,4-dihydroxy-6-naphthoate synthase [Bacteroidales bacterium]